jgi:hypothetical protein
MPQPEESRSQPPRGLPPTQDINARPIVSEPHLPAMENRGEVRTVLRNTLLPLMGSGAHETGPGSGNMAPVPAERGAPSSPGERPQQPHREELRSVSAGGYVRLTVRLQNGQLSVTGVKQVPGPLEIPSAVIRGHAYEVLLNEQQIALGSIPDIGVRRSFANRNVEGPEGKHHFAPISTGEFSVRIPMNYVSTANLPKLTIVLHDVREAPDRFTNLLPLHRQSGVNTVEVSRLTGIRLEQLSPAVRPNFEEILRESDRNQ